MSERTGQRQFLDEDAERRLKMFSSYSRSVWWHHFLYFSGDNFDVSTVWRRRCSCDTRGHNKLKLYNTSQNTIIKYFTIKTVPNLNGT